MRNKLVFKNFGVLLSCSRKRWGRLAKPAAHDVTTAPLPRVQASIRCNRHRRQIKAGESTTRTTMLRPGAVEIVAPSSLTTAVGSPMSRLLSQASHAICLDLTPLSRHETTPEHELHRLLQPDNKPEAPSRLAPM
jgi:hypothetical protein